jgi:hypothetical protein
MAKNRQALAAGTIRKTARALKYADLGTVLANLQPAQPPTRAEPAPRPDIESSEVTVLRAEISRLRSQTEQLADRFGDELERLTERIAKLEHRAQMPWWSRALGSSRNQSQPAKLSRRKAVARLRALSLRGNDSEYCLTDSPTAELA